jgi:enamine deaminase RidA (YjgF/YER057c/UK114 family)
MNEPGLIVPGGAAAPEFDWRARLDDLGLKLHGPHLPHHPLEGALIYDGIAHVSGQLPRIDGKITCFGRLGGSVSVEEGVNAAEVCALNALSVLVHALGGLDRVKQILRVTGFVASTADFHQQPVVVDGASSVFFKVLGAAGRHSRSAIGVAALPHGAAVEIEVTAAIRS